ncbi:hypothetical protein [Microbacterium suwonense]|uniref:Uncharacterized protein n=1 Tax=Microbacterium suwonense TaxID=683047 RepID=A0ABN6X500_9MICO|nr:hypothetical protein [Microbacterium suwonense]BDZ39741.1 hypothetical protein GCM10025863_23550 [Microbacterium suwonense]
MSGFAVKTVIILIVIALVVVLIARAFRRVAPAKVTTRRQRMPMLVVVAGVVLLAAGFLLGVAAFASRYTAQLLPARIASVVLFLVGVALLLAYRNWYLEAGADAVRFRTVFGSEKHIAYRDIASCRTVRVAGRERVVVRSRDGVRLSVDRGRYNVAALLAAAG